LRTLPKAPCHFQAGASDFSCTTPDPPRLFRAYLDLSARLCGPPAIDREFGTIDFLTLLDLQVIPQRLRTRFF
jgi:putative hemolysin